MSYEQSLEINERNLLSKVQCCTQEHYHHPELLFLQVELLLVVVRKFGLLVVL